MLMFLLLSGITAGVAQTARGLQLSANVSESGCAGTLHTVAVEAIGGKAPYSFSWSDGRTGSFRNDLKGGTYTCTVSDSEGKIAKKTFTLSHLPQELTANARQEKVGDQTIVHIEARGGHAPYIYYWYGDGLDDERSKQSNKKLVAGKYIVIVKDAKGCTRQLKFSIDK